MKMIVENLIAMVNGREAEGEWEGRDERENGETEVEISWVTEVAWQGRLGRYVAVWCQVTKDRMMGGTIWRCTVTGRRREQETGCELVLVRMRRRGTDVAGIHVSLTLLSRTRLSSSVFFVMCLVILPMFSFSSSHPFGSSLHNIYTPL